MAELRYRDVLGRLGQPVEATAPERQSMTIGSASQSLRVATLEQQIAALTLRVEALELAELEAIEFMEVAELDGKDSV